MRENYIKVAIVVVVALGMTGCFSPEYSQNYISANPDEFEQYKEEAGNRPSPPARATQILNGATVFVTYCQPSVKGREIWGDLEDYDEIWRTGANEATVLSTDKEILVGGQTVAPGDYALYTIPRESGTWTVILNSKYETWGAYQYDESLDVARFEVQPVIGEDLVEQLTFDITPAGKVIFNWEYLSFEFPITVN
ncbi:MAG: DUF2911 domain-containing protein [Reichenbachiella sp.]